MVENYESYLVENIDIWTVNFWQEPQSLGFKSHVWNFYKTIEGRTHDAYKQLM